MQSQPNRQEPLSYNGAFSPSAYSPRLPDSMTPGFTQSATPYYNAQSSIHGPIPAPAGPGIGHRNDVYGGNLIPGYEFNPVNRSWEAPAPQAHNHSGHRMPSVQYDYVGQGRNNYTGYDFAANQFLDPPMSFSPLLSGAYTAPNNQRGFPVWRLFNGWVSYAVEDELHVTIALRRIRVPSA